jgi:SAM-dependent methyltransferase
VDGAGAAAARENALTRGGVADRQLSRENDPEIVRREYASEDRFLARRLRTWAELDGPIVEDATVDAVAEGAPARVLDVGCGTGDFSERLGLELGVDLVALDLSARMADLARARRLQAIQGDVQALPFAEARFDCVLANRVLYHVPDVERGLGEIARALRPGGRLLAVTYGEAHLCELWELVGESPLASSPFSAENGAAPLRRHFEAVERRDFTGNARFPTRRRVLEFLGAFGEFSDVDLPLRVVDIPEPLDASYRHSIFLARKALR